ncbi:MAG: hypothetical protein C0445_01955 [Polaromonas sp.]|nr:hypothetical protein [Polaromonas sp.]
MTITGAMGPPARTHCVLGAVVLWGWWFTMGQSAAFERMCVMLQSYSARLVGNQLVWLGAAPVLGSEPRQVMVVLDAAPTPLPLTDVQAKMNKACGSLGSQSREGILAELERSRQDWER